MKTNIAKIVAAVNRMNIITRIIISHGMRYIYACSAPLRRYRCCGPVFLNALLRETKDWHYLPATRADELSQIHIPLSPTRAIRVPVRYFSPTQHHQYCFPATLIQADSDGGDTVTFHQLIDFILEKETVKGALDADTLARFKQRVSESHTHTGRPLIYATTGQTCAISR